MFKSRRFLFVVPALLLAACATQPLEVWLASTASCNSCDIYAEVAQARGYNGYLTYENEAPIAILHKDKSELTPKILRQMQGATGPESADWPIQLTVMVVRGNRVLSFGNIADSADTAAARHPLDRMEPPANPEADHPSLQKQGFYREFFLHNWNLEHFIAQALNRPVFAPTNLIDFDAANPYPLADSNVILWGSAAIPLRNSRFIADRLTMIRGSLRAVTEGEQTGFVVLYGHGPNATANDTSAYIEDRVEFSRAPLHRDLDSGDDGMNRLLTSISRSTDSRNLLVQVGHSNTFGSPLWGRLAPVTAAEIAAANNNKVSLVMISGACHGGVYASAVDCGFFAAHPEAIAAGCQMSPSAIGQSEDYLKHFFHSIAAPDADTDANGMVSMEESHWYASVRVEHHQITYTKLDALADAHFEQDPMSLPDVLTVEQIRSLAEQIATPAEMAAIITLTTTLPATTEVALNSAVALHWDAQAKLHDATEMTSVERNAITAMPYHLIVPTLVRRLYYRTLAADDSQPTAVASCERQSIAAFLKR